MKRPVLPSALAYKPHRLRFQLTLIARYILRPRLWQWHDRNKLLVPLRHFSLRNLFIPYSFVLFHFRPSSYVD